MHTRQALEAFYHGPVWQANKAAAAATMLDSDNVLLLRPAGPAQGFAALPQPLAGQDTIIGVTIYYLGSADAVQFAQFFEHAILPHFVEAGIQPIARPMTEETVNNYPRLPIREHDRTFIWFARWENLAAESAFVAKFSALSGWRDSAPESILAALMRKPKRLRLMPTSR